MPLILETAEASGPQVSHSPDPRGVLEFQYHGECVALSRLRAAGAVSAGLSQFHRRRARWHQYGFSVLCTPPDAETTQSRIGLPRSNSVKTLLCLDWASIMVEKAAIASSRHRIPEGSIALS